MLNIATFIFILAAAFFIVSAGIAVISLAIRGF